jgi:hypothetical protein
MVCSVMVCSSARSVDSTAQAVMRAAWLARPDGRLEWRLLLALKLVLLPFGALSGFCFIYFSSFGFELFLFI